MREDGVEVRVQLQQDDLPEVGVVDVGEHVEEQPVDLPDVRVERRGELLTLHGQNKLRERGKLFIKRINCTPKQYSTPYNFDRRMLARGQGGAPDAFSESPIEYNICRLTDGMD